MQLRQMLVHQFRHPLQKRRARPREHLPVVTGPPSAPSHAGSIHRPGPHGNALTRSVVRMHSPPAAPLVTGSVSPAGRGREVRAVLG
ncbi:hypothetical protein GCM10017562_59560 [Streptomyces roseofulvus]